MKNIILKKQKLQKLCKMLLKIKIIIIFLLPLLKQKINKNDLILKIIDYIEKKRSYLISNQFEKELPNIKDYINNLKHNINTTFINYVEQINPKISIIVPVYNKVKYLPTLILSIEFQSLK